jgi:hypothetical protein
MRTWPGGETSGSGPGARFGREDRKAPQSKSGHQRVFLPHAQRRLVAVMTVGDEQLSRRHLLLQPPDPLRVRHPPQPVPRLLVIRVFQLRRLRRGGMQHFFHVLFRIGEQHEDRVELHARGLEQAETVFFRPAERALVAEDGLAIGLRGAQSDEAEPHERPAAIRHGKDLLVDKHGFFAVLREDALAAPLAEPRRRARIIAAGQDQVREVVRAARLVVALQLFRNDIVGERGQRGDVAGAGRVAQRAEWMDACHGCGGNTTIAQRGGARQAES